MPAITAAEDAMSTEVAAPSRIDAVEALVLKGDVSRLSPEERLRYYLAFCEAAGLNPVTMPAQYLQLSGRTVLYVTRAGTDQLRRVNGVSIEITSREMLEGGIYVVSARARTPDGRTDEAIGAVDVSKLSGEALANALMKAETKAKRRATLSICGLGLLDESEIESLPDASPAFNDEIREFAARSASGEQPRAVLAEPSAPPPAEAEPAGSDEWPTDPVGSVDELIEWLRDMFAASLLDQRVIARRLAQLGYTQATISGRIRAAVEENPELLVPAAWRTL